MAWTYIGNKQYMCLSTDEKGVGDRGSILIETNVVSGERKTYQTIDGNTWSLLNNTYGDIYLDISKGYYPSSVYSPIIAIKNACSTNEQDVWDGCGNYTYPTESLVLTVVSDSEDDTYSDGSGARTVQIIGLDEDYKIVVENLNISGSTPVQTVNSYFRIIRCTVVYSGNNSFNLNVGTITFSNNGITYAQINPNNNTTFMGVFTIPANAKAYILDFTTNAGKDADFNISVYVKGFNQTLVKYYNFKMYENSFNYNFKIPRVLEPKTEIAIRASSNVENKQISAYMELLVVFDELLF